MAEHCITAEVGRFYAVPCMYSTMRGTWVPTDGWVPVLGPKHEDGAILNFPHQHYHIDWRFIRTSQYRQALHYRLGTPHASVLTNTHGSGILEGSPVLKRRKCLRAMPDHPATPDKRWAALEVAQAGTCNRLKPGNICPHRGIDLTPFVKPDGTVICPGHGLRWDTRTGVLLPHHTGGRMSTEQRLTERACTEHCAQGRNHACPMPETPSLRNPWVLLVYAIGAVAAVAVSALLDYA